MAANNLQFNTNIMKELDQKFVQDSVTGFLSGGAFEPQFIDANTVKVPEVAMSGLTNYDRQVGFKKGSIAKIERPYTVKMDRSASFDVDEVDGKDALIEGARLISVFQKEKVTPEIDAYNLSTLYYYASQANNAQSLSTSSSNIYSYLLSDVNNIQGKVGYGTEPLVIFMGSTEYGKLRATTEFTRMFDVADFKRGDITTRVKTIDDIPIIPVPDARMYSSYDFLTGDVGQEEGGFKVHTGANLMKWIILPKNSANPITKTQKIRTFEPGVWQGADAWHFDYRRVFDMLVMNSKVDTIKVAY